MAPCTFRSARPATSPRRTARRRRRAPPSCVSRRAAVPAAPFATGVRNGTGLAVAPDGSVWTAVNNRDNVAVPDRRARSTARSSATTSTTIRPSPIARLTPGRELGWPYCNPDGGPANLPLIRDVQTNADGGKLDCAALPPIEQSMGAHSAPLGMSFSTHAARPLRARRADRRARVVEPQPPRAPEVSFYPWRHGGLGDQQTLVGGFQDADGCGGAGPSRRSSARTARSTSPTTTPAPSTDWHPPAAERAVRAKTFPAAT